MKTFAKVLFVFSCLLFVASCSTKQAEGSNEEVQEQEFRNSLNSTDSLTVIRQGDSIMNILKAKNFDEAFNAIFELDSLGNVQSLSSERKRQLSRQFMFFPVNDFKMVDFKFNTSDQNIITYKIAIYDQNVSQSTQTTNFAFSPVKIDGKWYFTIRQAAMSDGHNVKSVESDSIE